MIIIIFFVIIIIIIINITIFTITIIIIAWLFMYQLYVFGGWTSSNQIVQYYSDLWSINTAEFHQTPTFVEWVERVVYGPGPRNSHTAVVYGNNLYVFGGFYHSGLFP